MEILSIKDEAKKIKNIVLDILKYSDECYEVFENKTRLLIVLQTGQPKVLIKLNKLCPKQLNCSCVTSETQTKRL